jgi:hypothetical protein
MAKKNAVAKTGAAALPAEVNELLTKYAGAGQEDFSADDFALPFLYLLQDLSPQVKARDPKYIEGAKAGDFLHSVTQGVIDGEEGFRCVPISHRKVYNEWVPRNEGGGFVASHATKDEAFRNRVGSNDIVDTANWFLLIELGEGNWQPVVMSCTSSKLKESRSFASRISMRKMQTADGPLTVPIRHGDFFNIRFEEAGMVEDADLATKGANLREMFMGGKLGLDFNKQVDTEATDDDGDDDQF